MNWEDSHLAAQAFSKSRGDMSLGDQWALASIMREGDSGAGNASAKPAKKKKVKEAKPYKESGKYIALAYFGGLVALVLYYVFLR